MNFTNQGRRYIKANQYTGKLISSKKNRDIKSLLSYKLHIFKTIAILYRGFPKES